MTNSCISSKQLPSQEYLKECFNYDESSGVLTWSKTRPNSHFNSNAFKGFYFSKTAGTIAGMINVKNSGTRNTLSLDTVKYNTLRIIWKLVTGEEPIYNITTLDGDCTNTKFSNLVHTDVLQNLKDGKLHNGLSRPISETKEQMEKLIGLYIIEFSNGIIKIGKSIDILNRIKHHELNAKCFNCDIIQYEFYQFEEKDLCKLESLILKSATEKATSVIFNEWFVGISFEEFSKSLKNGSFKDYKKPEYVTPKVYTDAVMIKKKYNNTQLELPSQEQLLETFKYDTITGELIRLLPKHLAGRTVGTLTYKGIKVVKIRRHEVNISRIIWKLMTDEQPKMVKFRNGNNLDVRWENLYAVY